MAKLPEKDDNLDRNLRISSGTSIDSLGGVSTLDISTRLKITEAELAIVRNEVSELVTEKNMLDSLCKKHESSWKFALYQLGRMVEERDRALAQVPAPASLSTSRLNVAKSPEVKLKKMKSTALKSELENCLQLLEAQAQEMKQIEQERDKANDDLEYAKVQIHTLLMQQCDLLNTCTEVNREKDRAVAEATLLRTELNRYDRELHTSVEFEIGEESDCTTEKDKLLLQKIRLLRDEKEQLQRTFQQSVEHYKRQIQKCNMERRQTSTSADAMKALLQRQLESFQTENSELRSELRTLGDVTSHLKDQLAQVRLACQHQNGYIGEVNNHDDMPPDSQMSSQGTFHLPPGRCIPPLSQDTGISLYNSKTEGGSVTMSGGNMLPSSSELITPGNPSSGNPSTTTKYRVTSARGMRKPYIPTASPFPEESRGESSEEEEASWI